ncbi:MAG TPA: tandem-95 repeat protein [Actinomycetota bacterium]|nr:tandem-95 repeat protein [Actinomycetota bacterium]
MKFQSSGRTAYSSSRKSIRGLLSGLLIAASLLGAAQPVIAVPEFGTVGGQLFGTGGEVTVQVMPATAGLVSELHLCSPGSGVADSSNFIALNTEVGRVVNLGSFPEGTELVFCIYVRNSRQTFYMGPASRNPDNIAHASVQQTGTGTAKVGFEDLLGGGDRDYNDNVFNFTGVIPNRPPAATNDAYSTSEDTPLNVTAPGVLANDSDAEGEPLAATLVSGPANGTVALNSDGSFTYTPSADFNGSDSFTYKVSDGESDSNVATVDITVQSVNDAPDCSSVVSDTSAIGPANHTLSTVTLSGGSDPEGGPVTVSVTGVTQDEAVNGLGDGDTAPDAVAGAASNQVALRAERAGNGDGRVYAISYSAADADGGACTGTTQVFVPHDQRKGPTAVDSGQAFNSFGS